MMMMMMMTMIIIIIRRRRRRRRRRSFHIDTQKEERERERERGEEKCYEISGVEIFRNIHRARKSQSVLREHEGAILLKKSSHPGVIISVQGDSANSFDSEETSFFRTIEVRGSLI